MTVYIGFTTGGGPPTWELLFSAVGLQVPGKRWRYIKADPSGADWARNQLVRQFLDNDDAEWLLQVDRDAILHPQTLRRLLSWDKRVISALAFTRGVPPMPIIWSGQLEDGQYITDIEGTARWLLEHEVRTNREWLIEPRPDDALVQVERTGAHCLLVHRSVYEEIEPPWFQYHRDRTYGNRGEDFYFCSKLEAADIPIYVDRSVIAGHSAGGRSIGALDFLGYKLLVGPTKEAGNG